MVVVMVVIMVVVVVEGQTNTLRATVSWQQTKYVTVSDTRHTRSPAGCHSGLIISQPVSSGRVALLPVVIDTQTKGEATLRRQVVWLSFLSSQTLGPKGRQL